MGSFRKAFTDYRRHLFNTFWFVPATVSLLGPLFALLFLKIDALFPAGQDSFLFRGGISDASTILSTIAGSLITVAGLAFSITIVVLQLVSSQYTPRALRGFLQDRITQVIAGGFFALIVLAVMREASPANHGFLPSLSITVALGLSFLGLAFLLVFVHHTGRIIQVSDIAARIAAQTLQTIEHPYPDWEGEERVEEAMSDRIQTWRVEEEPARIRATRPGYVQRIELASLMNYLLHPGFHLRLLVCPGDFVTEETVIAEIRPMRMADTGCVRAIHAHIAIERERDIAQDARFGVRQLADIALRALSPAINDPTTGVLCIKYLQAVFEHLVHHLPQPAIYRFAGGTSSLEIIQPTFEEYLEVFVEIGHYAGGNVRVIRTLITVLMAVTKMATLQEQRDLLVATTATLAALDPVKDSAQSNDTIIPPRWV